MWEYGWRVAVIAAALFWVGLSCFLYAKVLGQEFTVEGEVSGWFNRAKVASSAEDMVVYLENTQAGMDKYGMTEGSAGLVRQLPSGEMSLIRAELASYTERAQTLIGSEGTDSYRMGMIDLRNGLSQLHIKDMSHYWRHQGLGQAIQFFSCLGGGLLALLVLWGSLAIVDNIKKYQY